MMAQETATTETTTEQAPASDAAVETAETVNSEAEEAVQDETVLGGEAAAEEAPAEPVIPEKYEFAASEGAGELDADMVAAATPVLQELKLTNEQAQTLVPLAESIVARTYDGLAAQGAQQRADWLTEAKADPEIGGDKWNSTVQMSAKALDAMGYPEGHAFREALNATGFGNNPDMIRMTARLGAMVSEDGTFPTGGTPPIERDVLHELYPDDVPKT